RQSAESRGIVPSRSSDVGIGLAHRLIVEEGEDLIFPDGAADAATELLELIVVSGWRIAAVVALKGVQVRLMGGEEEAAVNVVSAALGSDLKLSAAEAAIFSVIAVGDYFHTLNGVFRRRDDSRTAPDRAGG